MNWKRIYKNSIVWPVLVFMKRRVAPPPAYLRKSKGVIHIGANDGYERVTYHRSGVDVLWVEAIPAVFEKLQRNIAPYPRQRAINCLLADRDDTPMQFNVASNGGQSSSILPLQDHNLVFEAVTVVETLELVGQTFDTVVVREGIDMDRYDCLVIDTQGAEIMVLSGAEKNLPRFRYILAEAADFAAYEGGATLGTLTEFLAGKGFALQKTYVMSGKKDVGVYYDALYRRVAA